MTKAEKGILAFLGTLGAFFGIKKLVEAAPPGLGSLSGVVTDIETGLPIDGIEITLNGLTYTTIEDGVFEFLEVDAGTYTLVATDPLIRYGGETMSVTLEAGETRELSVSLVPITPAPASLYGRVTDSETGYGIEGVTVEVVGMALYGHTDSAGNYTIPEIPPGTYTIRFTHPDYEPLEI